MKVYEWLLVLYPRRVRERFGDGMRMAFAEDLARQRAGEALPPLREPSPAGSILPLWRSDFGCSVPYKSYPWITGAKSAVQLFVRPSVDNGRRLIRAIAAFGFPTDVFTPEDIAGDHDVPFIGRSALLKNKTASGRLQDRADVEALGGSQDG